MNAAEIIKKDLDAIYIGNLSTVDDDLTLPENGKYGAQFIWETGEERFIDNTGKVHRPLHGMGNRKVTLTVTATYEGYSESREYVATVLQEAKENIVKEVRKVVLNALVGEEAHLPSVVIVYTEDGRRMTMPVKWNTYEPAKEETVVAVAGVIDGTEKEASAEIHYKKEIVPVKGPEKKVGYFPLGQVRLKEGTLYYKYQKLMEEYLLGIDDDQMLYNFRKATGLDTKGAPPMTGWDEESCKLKGHTTGHYLSGIALAFAATGNLKFLDKVNYMVAELKKCQDAFAATGKYHRGFLSAYSEEQFDLLEVYTKYPEIWAPYYTLDKIMSGLYDCHVLAGNETAKEILDLMGDWVYDRLSRLPKETLDKMWAMYIAGEFGGMLGTMVKVYELTGKENHLKAAKLFENEKLFYPMEEECDTLEDMHANQHIPQIIGAMDLYRATGDEIYWEIGKNFWNIVTGGHTYCIGGVGETEMFHRANTTCSYLTDKAAESCASYNMLRLTSQLFEYTRSGNLMDYYDNTLRNHILTSSSHKCDGGTTYFLPLGPGGRKEFFLSENSCCHGTGMESRFRYMENIYAQDEDALYINLLVDSVLTDENGKAMIELQSVDEEGVMEIRCQKDQKKVLKIHIPAWGQKDFNVSVNGKVLANTALHDGYLVIDADPKAGDVIRLELPMEFRVLDNKSDAAFVNLAYGPYILAALSEEKEFLTAPAVEEIHRVDGKLQFEANGMKMIPLPKVDMEAYHVYFHKE